jgi:uncharacterized protein
MPPTTHEFDLAGLSLAPGEGRRLQLATPLGELLLGGQRYLPEPMLVPVTLEVSRMVGHGYALRMRFSARLTGPCMRCLKDAQPSIAVDAREVDRPGGGEQLQSPYLDGETLDLAGWAHDAFALEVPSQVLCREDCAGLCPICAIDLNEAGPAHRHERAPDPRWAKLGELKLQ